MKYPDLDFASRKTVWKTFLSRADTVKSGISERDLVRLARKPLNGRQVRLHACLISYVSRSWLYTDQECGQHGEVHCVVGIIASGAEAYSDSAGSYAGLAGREIGRLIKGLFCPHLYHWSCLFRVDLSAAIWYFTPPSPCISTDVASRSRL